MSRYLIGFKPNLRSLIPKGLKRETMRTNKRWLKVKKGDELWVKGKGMMSGYRDACMVLVATKDSELTNLWCMTPEHAKAEGMHGVTPMSDFVFLWNKINPKKPKRFQDNPEVVRLTFRFDRMLK